ncbi:MAG: LysM peptidoglycan-binding domain-containing protein [Coriobacteriia bacterium]|nr:LysM peptidoglycan-binding domain-containing protein [Coriobacteriia bacterium]
MSTIAAGRGRQAVTRRRTAEATPALGWHAVLGPVFWAVALAALLVCLGSIPRPGQSAPSGATASTTVRVASTDTLWSIATENRIPGRTIAATVAEIRRMNHLADSSLRAGSVLRVPEAGDTRDTVALAELAASDGVR